MELWLGVDEEMSKSVWVRTKEKTGLSDIVVEICYRSPDQEEQVDEDLYRQIGIALYSQALVRHEGL